MNREIYNTVLIHTARSWERVRLEQPNEEMPYDNIESVYEIECIATTIYNDKVIQGFIKGEGCHSAYWFHNTKEGMSDTYIESRAVDLIKKEILN
tara:strand:- start:393 stop:677 length:285 start_codon:yes stop_codon:yes gene_type:complete